MTIHDFGFDEWADDLAATKKNILPEVKKVTSKTLLEMKKTAQKIVRGNPHIKHLARSFNYDVHVYQSTIIVGEVGADLEKKQGAIDHIIENGGIHSSPIPHWRPAAEEQVPLWEKYLSDAAVEAIGD